MTFSKFDDHSSPLFRDTKIIKLVDLVDFHINIFMHKFHNKALPSSFDCFFKKVNEFHNYNTRHSTKLTYLLPKIRTDYGLSNIKYKGPLSWNNLDKSLKSSSMAEFRRSILSTLVEKY